MGCATGDFARNPCPAKQYQCVSFGFFAGGGSIVQMHLNPISSNQLIRNACVLCHCNQCCLVLFRRCIIINNLSSSFRQILNRTETALIYN